MIPLSLPQIADAVSGTLIAESERRELLVSGSVRIDSRAVNEGDLFIAIRGEQHDGHSFASGAAQQGAVVLLVDRHIAELDTPQIVVEDTVSALGALAAAVLAEVRSRAKIAVVAITGSNGKTTTKNLLGAMLAELGETMVPQGSFNNQIGAPLSLLQITEQTRFAVVEMGADEPGQIRNLVAIANPDLAVVLKVGLAHVGGFGSIDDTARAKAELVTDLVPEAKVLLNADDFRVRQMAEQTAAEVHYFSTETPTNPQNVVWAEGIVSTLDGTQFILHWGDGTALPVHLQILGQHHVANALAAAGAARQLGVSPEIIVRVLQETLRAERWRMERLELADGTLIINDAYNASPDSSQAALRSLADFGHQSGRRTIAVLGHMAELGEHSDEQHDALGILLVRLGIDRVFVIGEKARRIHETAVAEGLWNNESEFLPSLAGAAAHIRAQLHPGDIVLVKSSKSAELRHLGDELAGVQD